MGGAHLASAGQVSGAYYHGVGNVNSQTAGYVFLTLLISADIHIIRTFAPYYMLLRGQSDKLEK